MQDRQNGAPGHVDAAVHIRASAGGGARADTYSGRVTDTQEKPAAATAVPTGKRGKSRAADAVLGLGALASLIAVLVSLYRLTGMADGLDETGVMTLALSLFSPIMVAAFAGAVGGLLAGRLPGPRAALTAAGFVAVGLAAAIAAYALFRVDAAIALTLAAVLFAAAVLGGLFALPRRRPAVLAGLCATLLLLALMFVRGVVGTSTNLFADPLDELGAMGGTAPLIAGLACGLVAFGLLRASKATVRMYGYLLAGALPGAIWLLSTIIAQVGVEIVLALGVDEVSLLDEANLSLSFQWQYNGSMTVLFAGAVCAVLAYGLLLPKADSKS